MKRNLAIPAVLLAALFWGTTGTSQSFAPEGASPLAFGAVRLAIGGLFLLSFSAATGRLKLKGLPLPALLVSSAGMALYQPLFFSGVTQSGIAAGTVAALGSAPVIAGLLEWLLTARKPAVKWWIATAGAAGGCLLLFADKPSRGFQPAGLLLSVGAGAAFAVYALFSKKLLERHSPETAAAAVFSLSALWLSPLLLFTDLSWLITVRGTAVSLYIGIAATGVAYLLFNYGLSRLQASTTVTFSLAEPLAAAVLGILALGEPISGWGIAGLLLMLGALLLLAGK
ncbi:EamA family transporter [Paenibacillus sp. S150]|uniref:EamA family transporter n=1 Tax=Paenibacillus sp. S150 TaxID=2749826 RepID=UPI00281568EC|nr:EamA family transporter [Paenibacillus sp. S150]